MDASACTRRGKVPLIAALAAALALLATSAVVVGATPKTTLINQDSNGDQVAVTDGVGINHRGQYVTFVMDQDDPGNGDKNGAHDVYLRKVDARRTSLMSVNSKGAVGSDDSWDPAISDWARFVAFASEAPNLPGGGSYHQIYLRDRLLGKTMLISKSPSGPGVGNSEDPDVSANGRFVVFQSDADLTAKAVKGVRQIYLRDRQAKRNILVSKSSAGVPGRDESKDPQISSDGRYVVYVSEANNLVPTWDKGQWQVYRYDRLTRRTELISKNRYGKAGNDKSEDAEISANGKVVVYESDASNLVANDTNGFDDIFMYRNGKTSRVSLNHAGKQLRGGDDGAEDPDISANGRWLVFESNAENATKYGNNTNNDHTYLRDLRTGRFWLVSRTGARIGNGQSGNPRISGDGRYVLFTTDATNLIPGGDANGSDLDLLRRGPYR